MKKTNIFLIALAVFVALGATAAASVYLTKQSYAPEETPVVATAEKPAKPKPVRNTGDDITWNRQQPAPVQQQPVRVASNCDDSNIVGTIAGGAAGALIGSQIGSGSGKTAAVIGGTLGGAYLGNSYMPTRNVTCR